MKLNARVNCTNFYIGEGKREYNGRDIIETAKAISGYVRKGRNACDK